MACDDTLKPLESGDKSGLSSDTPRRRLRLKSQGDIQDELARLYRAGRFGDMAVTDVSRLANVLQILSKIHEVHELEVRLNALIARIDKRDAGH